MLLFAFLALLPLSSGAPVWPSFSTHTAELGGTVIDGLTGRPLPSPVPVVVNLYSADQRVASAQPDLFGRYSLVSPPGDYWLQIMVGGQEQRLERVLLRPGSWRRDFTLGVPLEEVWAAREALGDRGVTTALRARGDHAAAAPAQSSPPAPDDDA